MISFGVREFDACPFCGENIKWELVPNVHMGFARSYLCSDDPCLIRISCPACSVSKLFEFTDEGVEKGKAEWNSRV